MRALRVGVGTSILWYGIIIIIGVVRELIKTGIIAKGYLFLGVACIGIGVGLLSIC